MILTKTMNLCSRSLDKPKILILAPTRVTGINIDRTNISLGLCIPPFVNGYSLL